jgi:hypothetical protein
MIQSHNTLAPTRELHAAKTKLLAHSRKTKFHVDEQLADRKGAMQ